MSQGGFPGDVVAAPAPASEQTPAVAYTNPEQAKALGESEGEDAAPQGLVGYIRSAWSRNKRARDIIDVRLLDCLRARRAEYDTTDLNRYSVGAMKPPYLPLTAMKMRAAEASLLELLLPEHERAFGIDPTPVPSLSEEIEAIVTQQAFESAQKQMQAMAQQGQGTMTQQDFIALSAKLKDQMYDVRLEEERRIAKERARRMEDRIADRMDEGNYGMAMRAFISHYCTYPAAILKGPFTKMTKKLKWGKDPSKPEVVMEPTMAWAEVNPFDCYPAPQARDCQEGDFIERMRFTRGQLYGMIGLEGYDEAAIRRVLDSHSSGGLQSWLMTDMERRAIEGVTNNVWRPEYIVDALHFWGSVQGRDLYDHGITEGIEDPLGYYEIDAILIGNDIIRCEVNDDPLGRRPYRKACFDEVPGAFWGNSLYELMKDAQSMANACFRALNANMGLASGPIMGVDMSKLAAGEDPKALRPLDVLQLDTQRSSNQDASKALIFFQAEDRAPQLLSVMEQCKKEADDLTGIPRYMAGDGSRMGGAGETYGGLSMLMGNAEKGIKRCVTTIDMQVIAPTVFDAYTWEMLYGKDEEVKGDCFVVPGGAAAILVKERVQQSRIQFLQFTANPIDQQIIGPIRRAKILREIGRVLHMAPDDVAPSEEEMQAQMAQPPPPPQPSPDAVLKSKDAHDKLSSTERIAGAKIAAKMTQEQILHPEKAAMFKTELSRQANAAYTKAGNNPDFGGGGAP